MRRRDTHLTVFLILFLPILVSSCAYWHNHVTDHAPEYTRYPVPGFLDRLSPTNLTGADTTIMDNVKDWGTRYTNALGRMFPWVPDQTLLDSTLTNVCSEYGQSHLCQSNKISKMVLNDLASYFECCTISSLTGSNQIN